MREEGYEMESDCRHVASSDDPFTARMRYGADPTSNLSGFSTPSSVPLSLTVYTQVHQAPESSTLMRWASNGLNCLRQRMKGSHLP